MVEGAEAGSELLGMLLSEGLVEGLAPIEPVPVSGVVATGSEAEGTLEVSGTTVVSSSRLQPVSTMAAIAAAMRLCFNIICLLLGLLDQGSALP